MNFIGHYSSSRPCSMTYGIVLRSYLPLKQSCLVFDRSRGIIKGIFFSHGRSSCMKSLTNGALIGYRCIERGDRFFLEEIKCLYVPAEWVMHDILFLHHVIEITTVFLMEQFPDRAVFTTLLRLYRPLDNCLDEELWRIVFLGHLFMSLGIFPNDATTRHMETVLRLISVLEGTSLTSNQSEAWRKVMTRWLKRCLVQHPDRNIFKTTYFLN